LSVSPRRAENDHFYYLVMVLYQENSELNKEIFYSPVHWQYIKSQVKHKWYLLCLDEIVQKIVTNNEMQSML
jgi:hypothetical protein